MSNSRPMNLIMYHPTSDAGRRELEHQVAQIHADAVITRIKHLNCPHNQKIQLLDAIIADVKARAKEDSPIVLATD